MPRDSKLRFPAMADRYNNIILHEETKNRKNGAVLGEWITSSEYKSIRCIIYVY